MVSLEWLQTEWVVFLDKLNTLPAYVSAIIVIIIVAILINFLPALLKIVRIIFKFLFGWLGRFAVINAVSSFLFSRDSIIVKTIRAVFLAVSTFIASISGYTRGYRQGYKDAGGGDPGFWVSVRSIWRYFRN